MEFDSIFNKKEKEKKGMAGGVKKHLKEHNEHDLAALKSALENLFNEVEEDKVSARRAHSSLPAGWASPAGYSRKAPYYID